MKISPLLQDVYIAELLVESNVTLEAQTVMSVLNSTNDIRVTSSNGSLTVSLLQNELIAECLLIGDDTSCNCSAGYIWSNEVCYSTTTCCTETTCTKNVSHITPLCVAKVHVHINGSVTLPSTTVWGSIHATQLETAFKGLNGFEYLNITGNSLTNMADFEAAVSVKFVTSKLQEVVTSLETALTAVVWVDTVGMVTIESPETTVCYESTPLLKCTIDEETGSAGWNMSRIHKRFELNNGTVVQLDHNCSTPDYKSCVAVRLNNVTGIWAGKVGYKSRTCDGSTWQPVFSYCVNEELNKVVDAADNFKKGLGATQAVAMDIFEGLKNSSLVDSGSDDSMADISASINILNVMASATTHVVLQEGVFPNLVDAASNMLNKTWDGVNSSTVQNMSSDYLQSVEGLVKNIKVNKSRGFNSQNLDLKFCSGLFCFDNRVSCRAEGTRRNVKAHNGKIKGKKRQHEELDFNHIHKRQMKVEIMHRNSHSSMHVCSSSCGPTTNMS
ncbi:adhesion G-protein coupled receptor F3-like protein [Lates japonicus]|uniref:Adhesion G-protein coupled receptor F3-like protein n=1 Tax=Lates japonicus TaxID=270547 RepID=A0AAD3MTW8_LATJO|nr:adhesion G-protein coupled receptor F3-like protein [Lates japonicus]